jgi:hypothetical protein
VTSTAHCPVLAAQEGYSRDPSPETTVDNLLLDSQPLFLPEGGKIGATVPHGEDIFLRAFYLPKVCNLPLGLRWPIYIRSLLQVSVQPWVRSLLLLRLFSKHFNPLWNPGSTRSRLIPSFSRFWDVNSCRCTMPISLISLWARGPTRLRIQKLSPQFWRC